MHKLRRDITFYRMFYLEEQSLYVLSLYTYIENVYTYDAPVEELAPIAGEEISPRAAEDIMTIAEKIRVESKLEGKLEEKINIAKKMLAEGVDTAFVAKISGLSFDQIKKLQN